MKKNLWLYISALAALLTVSCTRDPLPDNSGMQLKDGQTGLVMRVRSAEPSTRAIAAPAELNEYRLEQFYYFIYAVKPDENPDALPVLVGKWTAPSTTPVNNIGTETNIPLDNYLALQKDETHYAGFVYVIANYKANETAWDAIIASQTPDYSSFTWTALQALSLPHTFQSYQMVSGEEIMDENHDEGHRFKPQDSFVMDSKPVPFEVTKGEARTINAPLYRLAAKVQLNVNLAKWYIQTNNGHYKYTWYSDPDRIQIYLNYAADAGKMDRTALVYSGNESDFFTYRRFAFLQYPQQTGDFTENEPKKWHLDETLVDPETGDPTSEQREGEWYTGDESLANEIVVIDGEIQFKTVTRAATRITGTPFYSYPYNFSADSGHAPFFKVIVEWTAYTEPTGNRGRDNGPDPNIIPDVIAREFFYKITLPDIKILDANNCYTIDLNLGVLGSEVEETSIEISGEQGYYVVNWSDPSEPVNPDLNAGRYLNISSLEKDDDDNPVFEMYGNSLEIPIASSHGVEIVDETAEYDIYANPDDVTQGSLDRHTYQPGETESESDYSGNNYTVEPEGMHSVVLKHNVETNVSQMQSRDVSIITYVFTVKHTDDPNYSQKVVVKQYPSIYIELKDGGNAFLDGFFQLLDKAPTGYSNPISVTSPKAGYRSASFTGTTYQVGTYTGQVARRGRVTKNGTWDAILTPYGCLSYDGGMPARTTLVTVSTFSAESEKYRPRDNDPEYYYTISDPRTDNSWGNNHLVPYLTGQSGTSGNITLTRAEWTNLESDIKIGSGVISSGDKNLSPIAPAFLISSRWGRGGGVTVGNTDNMPRTLRQAEQRCATYQEAGYPAGRWRLPTEAEIYFVYQLQNRSLVGTPADGLFTGGGSSYGYMASSGRIFGYHGHNYFENANNPPHSFRCVYDYWYWGEKDRNVYKYTPKP